MPQLTLVGDSTIRVLYAVPADTTDRFAALAPPIVTDIAAIDAWWRRQDPTRSPRWDLYPFPACAAGFGQLDLGVLKLRGTAASYAAPGGYGRIVDELAPHVAPQEKTLVFFDGAFSDPLVCGISQAEPQSGGPNAASIVALGSGCGNDLGAGYLTARVAAHELVHNLGATPIEGPPNRCLDPRLSGHICDSTTDLMYPFVKPGMGLDDAILDIDHDDYYSHSGSWWDVRNSAWLIHLPRRTLAVRVSGPGRVASDPAAVDCTTSCTTTLDDGFAIRLHALPNDGAEFLGWSRACSSPGTTCILTMSSDRDVEARFTPRRPRLRVSIAGLGRVTSAPPGIDCPGHCLAPYGRGSIVTLRAQPRAGWKLARWSGRCGAARVCRLTVSGDLTERARFTRVLP